MNGKISSIEIKPEELSPMIETAVKKAMKDFYSQTQGEKLYSVNQVAKRLGRAHKTIKQLIKKGSLSTTKDGLVTEAAIIEYLQNV